LLFNVETELSEKQQKGKDIMEKTIKMKLECDGIKEILEKANLLKETLLEANQLADSLQEKLAILNQGIRPNIHQ
jgi:hypothetical protein